LAIRKAGDALAEAARTQLAEAYLQEMRARKEPMVFDLEEYWRRNNIPESEQDWGAPVFDIRNLEAAIAQEGAASLSPSELRLALNRAAGDTRYSIDPQSLSGPEKLALIGDLFNEYGHNYGLYPVQDPRGVYGATVFDYDKIYNRGRLPQLSVPSQHPLGEPSETLFHSVPGGKFTHYFEFTEPEIHHTTLSTPTARKIYQGLIQDRGATSPPINPRLLANGRYETSELGISDLVHDLWRVEKSDEIRNQLGPIAHEVLRRG